MMNRTAALLWRVPVGGHAWVSATTYPVGERYGIPARVLVAKLDAWREYHPLRDEPELFRRFAELEFPGEVEACEESVRRFADRYGALAFGSVGSLVDMPEDTDTDMSQAAAETPDWGQLPAAFWRIRQGSDLSTWYRAHWLLRKAVTVWDALQAGDTEALGRWFTWETSGGVQTSIPRDEEWPPLIPRLPLQFVSDRRLIQVQHLGWGTDPGDSWPEWPSGPVHWAMAHLRRWVNEQLGLHAKLRLRWVPASTDKMPLQAGVVLENLLGGLWWQLAMAIDGGLRYEQCTVCGQWFHVKPKGNRQNTRFCSGYCRLKAFRQDGHKRPKKKAAAR